MAHNTPQCSFLLVDAIISAYCVTNILQLRHPRELFVVGVSTLVGHDNAYVFLCSSSKCCPSYAAMALALVSLEHLIFLDY